MFSSRAMPIAGMCIALFSAASCTKKEQGRQYPFRGTVIRIDPSTNVATIHNEKVEGWMDPMTMEYPIESRDEYKALHPGEKIAATVNVTADGFSLTNVKPAEGK